MNKFSVLNPQAHSLLFAAVLLLLQPIQIEEVDPVFQIGGLREVQQNTEMKEGPSSIVNWQTPNSEVLWHVST